MSFSAFRWVRRTPTTGYDRAVLYVLADMAKEGSYEVRVKLDTLVEEVGFSRSTVKRSIDRLEAQGTVKVDRGKGRHQASRYVLQVGSTTLKTVPSEPFSPPKTGQTEPAPAPQTVQTDPVSLPKTVPTDPLTDEKTVPTDQKTVPTDSENSSQGTLCSTTYYETGSTTGSSLAPRLSSQPSPLPPLPETAPLDPGALNKLGQQITRLYTDQVPLSKFPAIFSLVKQALKAGQWTPIEVAAAICRLATEERSVTTDSLRYELNGFPVSGRSRKDQRNLGWQRLKNTGTTGGTR